MILAPLHAARLSTSADDLERALALRLRAFPSARASDRDLLDARGAQLLVERTDTGELAACLRLVTFQSGAELDESYSARFYDLAPFAGDAGPIVEIGRFCQEPGLTDPSILRVAWTALARHVLTMGTRMFIGCSSFRGADPGRHGAALAALRARHLFPAERQPGRFAPDVFDFATADLPAPDPRGIPSLLRSYLAIGGQVSNHAVIDRDLDTLHVFTALDIAAIPPSRARLLTAAAGM
jgi:L-ornithine Nalpha-acyltransferase